ncbi:GIY-YIG nuclease family protein [Inmirania thermothiophila]|uniref:Endonuclease-3 n=1 Tax=Inmirania thermothiophila TaxID=1750597 RepID=A0A3N1Y0H9_9GAMM|nr:GIY-YIG nuclease family protein [Inmirania thermothiophila]ROR32310.1 endonuclease-3 [Inmirania thermothiophila]
MSGGAYLLRLELAVPVTVAVGRLGRHRLPAGGYVYAGSARGGLAARVARHRRLALAGAGRRHWHVDALLLHPACRWHEPLLVPEGDECALVQALLARGGFAVPVAGFGASDCRRGCPAHLLQAAGGVGDLRL